MSNMDGTPPGRCECALCRVGMGNIDTANLRQWWRDGWDVDGPTFHALCDEVDRLRAENEQLTAALSDHDRTRADLSAQHEAQRLHEWQQADQEIKALRAEVDRVTALGAQWGQEREDAREQLGREMATVDDMVRDVARAESERDAALARVAELEAEVDNWAIENRALRQDGELLGEVYTTDGVDIVMRSITKARAERDALRAAVDRVRALHFRRPEGDCQECAEPFPCPTLAALDGVGESSDNETADPNRTCPHCGEPVVYASQHLKMGPRWICETGEAQ